MAPGLSTPGLAHNLLNQRQKHADVVARGNFRHDPAIDRVQVHLAVQGVRQQAALAVVKRHAGLVAGGFDAEHVHRRE